MADEAEARRAIAALNGHQLQGREMRVDASQPRSEKPHTRADATAERPSQRPSSGRTAAPASTPQPSGLRGFLKRLFG
jgi:RNA recognition motif-containing protein